VMPSVGGTRGGRDFVSIYTFIGGADKKILVDTGVFKQTS
jgi:hypothetical protein